MIKHKYDQKKLTKIALIVAFVSLIANCILAFVIYSERDRVNLFATQELNHHMEEFYNTGRITFCYDNNIRPCDLDQITVWNNMHPNEQFSVAPPTPLSH